MAKCQYCSVDFASSAGLTAHEPNCAYKDVPEEERPKPKKAPAKKKPAAKRATTK